jgi:translation initiation factor 2 alpha subunit (eIF-2alpha)
MPCVDPDHWPNQAERAWKRVDRLTWLLCLACRRLNELELGVWEMDLAPVHEWWGAHKAADEARIAREKANLAQEQARKELIARLSPAERELLGVSDRETFQLED